MAKTKEKEAPEETKTAQTTDARREKYLDKVAKINKEFGEGSIIQMGDGESEQSAVKVEPRSTGILSVDRATRLGGMPKGRVVEIFGPESSGKTTLTLHTIAEEQRVSPEAIINYVDLEHALEPDHMRNIGVKPMGMAYPKTGEEALEIVCRLTEVSDIVVVDSVSALVPAIEYNKSIGDTQPGRVAALMSQTLRRLVGIAARSGCTVIFINQIRHKIGISFGSPETTSGGNALKFYSSMRLDMRRIGTEKSGSEAYANRVRVKVVKNKCAPPFGIEEFTMFYEAQKTVASSAIEVATLLGIMEKSGSWYGYNGNNVAQGLAKTVDTLTDNPNLLHEITAKCHEVGINKKVVVKKESEELM